MTCNLPLTAASWQRLPHKVTVFGMMSPQSFLDLTVGRSTTQEVVFQETQISLSEYNPDDYAVPWLRVARNTGRLLGHNGRHRAAMILKDGIQSVSFPVCLILQEFRLKSKKYVTVKANELPEQLRNQFIPQLVFETEELFQPLVWF